VSRQLNVAPEVAKALSPAHLAQQHRLVDRDDNVCPACSELVLTDCAELVLLWDAGSGDQGSGMIRLTHPECRTSGIYAYPGIRELAAKQAARTDKRFDFHAATVFVPEYPVGWRLFCVVDVVRMSGCVDSDPVEMWAEELGLPPFKTSGTGLIKRAKNLRLRAGDRGIELVNGGQVTELGLLDRDVLLSWINRADQGLAWLVIGRGLPVDELANGQDFRDFLLSLGSIPCWGAPVRVERPTRVKIPTPWRR
jgi:hypothetical protein